MATKTKIELPKVAPYSKTPEELGDRVDRVLNQLTSDLQNFQAPDSNAIGGTTAAVINNEFTVRDLFFQTFETDIGAYWTFITGTALALTQPTNGKAGGKALSASTEVHVAFPSNIPYDDTRKYRMRVRYRRRDANPLSLRIGLHGYAADGLTVVDRNGSTTLTAQNNVCIDESAATPTTDVWVEATGYFQGEAATGDASTPSTAPETPRVLCDQTAYIRPFVHFNVGGGTTQIEVDFIAIEVLPERSEVDALLEYVDTITKNSVGTTINNGGGVANNQVSTGAIQAGAITTAKVAAGAITANEIAANTITAAKIAAGTITATEIAAGTITSSNIANGTIQTTDLGDGIITAVKIQDGIITASKIVNGTITSTQIAGGTITTNEIAANTIVAGNIASGTITATELNVSTLSAISATLGTVTAGLINNAGTSPTAGIRLDSGSTKPGTWTNYLDLAATGANAFLASAAGMTLYADGTADWPGAIINSPALTMVAATFHDDGTDVDYAVDWDYNSLANTTDHRIEIEMYENGVKQATTSAIAINATRPYTVTDTGGGDGVSDNHHVVVTLYEVATGDVVSQIKSREDISTV